MIPQLLANLSVAFCVISRGIHKNMTKQNDKWGQNQSRFCMPRSDTIKKIKEPKIKKGKELTTKKAKEPMTKESKEPMSKKAKEPITRKAKELLTMKA